MNLNRHKITEPRQLGAFKPNWMSRNIWSFISTKEIAKVSWNKSGRLSFTYFMQCPRIHKFPSRLLHTYQIKVKILGVKIKKKGKSISHLIYKNKTKNKLKISNRKW